jgi:hypothetical protein
LDEIMRRQLKFFIPITLLAIMVQLIAPLAAFRVVANAVSDPLSMATICAGVASSPDDTQTAPAHTQHQSGKCCAACATGHGGGLTVDPPLAAFVILQRQYQLISWLESTSPMPALRVGSNTQARAPPSFS